MLEKILDIIFPTSCGICQKIYKNWICPQCYIEIKNELKYQIINQTGFKLHYIGMYEAKLRKLILRFKFDESAYLANAFVELICKNKKFAKKIKEYDILLPVPMFYINKKKRGYNQTEILAKILAKQLKIAMETDVLIKIKQNKRQSELTEMQRRKNVKGVYDIQNIEKIANKKILLIDDIYTTGSTVKECVKIIKKAKIKTIDVLTIAKRH